MPQFQMPFGSSQDAFEFARLPAFMRGYVEAMFFTECSADNEELEHATFDELAPETLQRIRRDCVKFQWLARNLLRLAYTRDYSEEQGGRDFWFSRNGHGVGYWDRAELDAGGLGDALHALCRYSEVDLYRGDDGKLYVGG